MAVNVHKNADSVVAVELPPGAPGTRYTTFFEDSHSIPGWRTAVWEMDKGGLRNRLQFQVRCQINRIKSESNPIVSRANRFGGLLK